jgi:hypothetical protein
MKDLAVLVADKNMDFALRGILARPKSLSIRRLSYETKTHAGRDGGVRTSGPETLALLKSQFRNGLLLLDWEGSGAEVGSSIELENELDGRLADLWGNRAKAIVIDPELDSWVWGSDNAMSEVLGWRENQPIRAWLADHDFEFDPNQKPLRPKEALERVMVYISEPRSSILYEKLTSKISLARCVDPAFNRLKAKLQAWFPAQTM